MTDLTVPTTVADPATLSDAELRSLLRRLEREEHLVSRRRTTLHTRIDFLRAGAFASTDPEHESLEALQATQVGLSEHRH